MAFKNESNKVDYVSQEHEILKYWEDTDAFNKSRDLRKGMPKWSFQDGPITANNPMGVHHGWGRTYKDVMLRFQTMKGQELRYQNGFDCQGLWVEVEVEKDLGFESKKDIEEYGLDKFVLKCKERVLKFSAVQTEQSKRLGYWAEWNKPDDLRWLASKLSENPTQQVTYKGPGGTYTNTVEQVVGHLGLPETGGSYYTFSNENNYMIWTFLKKCWEKGWLYRGADVMPWCPRCATGISQHEIVTDGYAELTHKSVTLKFALREKENEFLLVWTTTPWTLTSNVLASVGPDLNYLKVKQGNEVYYLSKGATKILKGDYEVLGELKGSEMEGWTYDGPFDELPAANRVGGVTEIEELLVGVEQSAKQIHQVILWDEVGEEEGTGIVHTAPGCGAEDHQLGKEIHAPMIAPLNEEGFFVEGFDWLTGKYVGEVAPLIFDNLKEKGLLYNVADYTHRYPTCWRCKEELVFRLVDEWFISMGKVYDKPREELTQAEKDASLRYQIMDVVSKIRWIPEFGYSREMDWLFNMHDWMISKKRYWGLALPIWVCEDCGKFEVMGGDEELKERAIEGWDKLEGHTPHRPYVDAVKIKCPHCGGKAHRIPDVGNPWLDAGVVSFSTMRYRQDPEYWRKWFPADWISESFPGQFRNWFYSLLAMGTVLAGEPPFLQNFGYASVYAEDGREMHKSWGNAIEFNEAADKMGVDVMRWMYCAQKPENNLLFGYNRAEDVRRRFLIPLWNVYSFFVTYANLDNWKPNKSEFDPAFPEGKTPVSKNPLDQWILARLNQVIQRVKTNLDNSDFYTATMAVEPFIEDLTNWYIRRSRRRFWRSELDDDKDYAYATLYHLLVKLSKILAPFIPFVTEWMYQNLVVSQMSEAHASIHHTTWPQYDQSAVDDKMIKDMALARQIASLGLSARSNENLKVRQPLARALVFTGEQGASLPEFLVEIVADELNIKSLEFVEDAGVLVNYSLMPNNPVLGPRFGTDFPKVRKALDALDPAQTAKKIVEGKEITINIDGQKFQLTGEEVLVHTSPAEGLAVAADKIVTVGVDSVITPELKAEGLAREIIRRIQSMRKNADFNIEDRIATTYQADAELTGILTDWSDYICSETLSTSLEYGDSVVGAYTETHSIDDMELVISISKN
ncbi:MAG: isoleucine--tRNA ligase [Anaerolineales bacterium]|nr:isoleucine--tRNA ligase [Anaerolineales bacterium]